MENLAFNPRATESVPAEVAPAQSRTDAWLDQGLRFCDEGQWAEALAAFRKAAASDLRRSEPWHWMGRVQECLREPGQAAYCYFMAYGLDRHAPSAAALGRLGFLKLTQNKEPAPERRPILCLYPKKSGPA